MSSINKSLPSPLHTKAEEKRNAYSPGFASKYSNRTPAKDLAEMVSKVKEENSDENHCVVRTPNLSIPNAPNSIGKYSTVWKNEKFALMYRFHEMFFK